MSQLVIRTKPHRISTVISVELAKIRLRNALAAAIDPPPPSTPVTYARRRRAAVQAATPAWANKRAMDLIYARARARTRQTGIEHHVDHVVPIQSKVVCGLHVESNLRIVTQRENSRKHNIWRPMAW